MCKEKKSYTRMQFKKEFAKLMERTSIPNTFSQEESIKVLRELHDFVQPYIPAKLFRFRKCGIDELISYEQGSIPMCIAYKFPDKYDSNVFYDYKTLLDRFSTAFSTTMSYIVQIARSNPAAFPNSPIKSKLLELINSNTTDSEIVNSLRTDYDGFLKQMKSEIQKQEGWPRNNKYTKIGCFTEKIDSKFMWDHYADGYKGFALEYDFRKWYALNVNLYPVIYSPQMLDATEMIDRICITDYVDSIHPEEAYQEMFEIFKTQLHQFYPIDMMYFIKMYLYKDKADYSHEREWRMLKFDRESIDQDYLSIPDMGYLKAIYYGPHMEARYKTHLRSIAKAKGIREYDVVLDRNSRKYNLKVVPLRNCK
jgi:effector-binding domain-containing protein